MKHLLFILIFFSSLISLQAQNDVNITGVVKNAPQGGKIILKTAGKNAAILKSVDIDSVGGFQIETAIYGDDFYTLFMNQN
ncbi:MAG: hypothetical protein JEZ03_12630, partial [Bacteroidales bacterium]|nr:hypothetical protein [Bacteroidales bacterium]